MGGRCAVCLLLAVSALAACTSNLPGPPPAHETAAMPVLSGSEDEAGVWEARQAVLQPTAASLVQRLNAERSALGVPVLEVSDALSEIAFLRAEDMARRGYLASQDPQTGEALPLELMLGAGFGGSLAEVVAVASPGLQDLSAAALAEWLASPAHRAVLLDPVYRYAGGGLMPDGQAWKVVVLLAERAPEAR